MKKKNDDCLFDFAVEMTTVAGTEEIRIGYSPSRAEALKRTREVHPDAKSVRVLRVLTAYAPRSTPLSALSVSWEDVPEFPEKRFVLRDAKGREAASEYQGGHMRTAYGFLTSTNPKAIWKTVKLLSAVRQAIREDTANCYTGDLVQLLDAGPSKERVAHYLRGARARDYVHHGSHTF